MQARPQEPPEVYSYLLSPSVGETTGGILKCTPAVEAIAPQVYTQAPRVNTAPRGRKTVGKQPQRKK